MTKYNEYRLKAKLLDKVLNTLEQGNATAMVDLPIRSGQWRIRFTKQENSYKVWTEVWVKDTGWHNPNN